MVRQGWLFLVALPVCAAALLADDVFETAMRQLEVIEKVADRAELASTGASLRDSFDVGDRQQTRRLLALVGNAGRPLAVRTTALDAILAKADFELGRELLGWARASCPSTGARAVERNDFAVLLGRVVRGIGKTPGGGSLLADQASLSALKAIVACDAASPETRAAAAELIAASGAPIAQRRDAVVDILVMARTSEEYPTSYILLMNESALVRLRDALNNGIESGEFHYMAAAVLSHVGDVETLEVLDRWSACSTERPSLNRSIEHFRWRILVQRDQKSILEWITAGRGPVWLDHYWILRRAIELGIGKDELKSALESYVKNTPMENLRGRFRTDLAETAVSLGILRQGQGL
ncbi:hypothetical protein RAS1_33780 [Phycisphaerae bacterium RAS1]|nr:hypothetical protein RAS1_33780 [Phycisphaerae bacterium RAS1]